MRLALALLLVLAACGRPLTEAERALLAPIHGPSLDTAPIRIQSSPTVGVFPITYPARPRTTCRERIGPPPKTDVITGRTAGIVLFQRLFLRPDIARPDWAALDPAPEGSDEPPALNLAAAMFFVHEMTHVWQWQNRAVTGYHPSKAFSEHLTTDDPYLLDGEGTARFLDYGYEQQATLVEEYLCCATLDPDGARTARLHALVGQALPVAPPRSFPRDVWLPEGGDDPATICSDPAG
ncbi:hypothetical protein JQC91_16250 [Jannaschia sp. Os4]|uniref:hypothetical protein n=1 Tax=Jannaschia sp. Os4 TaxID=2807617 RepID=UPI00193ABE65|nr:hypothetical protein [Jannaschia sp. Os4]MBM2577860.1 hypothetical protein [Jannaschia sp. Os4]